MINIIEPMVVNGLERQWLSYHATVFIFPGSWRKTRSSWCYIFPKIMYEDQHCDLTKVLTSREKTEKKSQKHIYMDRYWFGVIEGT